MSKGYVFISFSNKVNNLSVKGKLISYLVNVFIAVTNPSLIFFLIKCIQDVKTTSKKF